MHAVVTGAGGFIGGHLAGRLCADGHTVRAVDIKPLPQWHQVHSRADNMVLDLRSLDSCRKAVDGQEWVFNLAADMGGIGFIETHKADCMLSVLISAHMLVAASETRPRRYLYTSSACVYPSYRQSEGLTDGDYSLAEHMAYPADPEDGYGWEKLFGERLCRHFLEDRGLSTCAARLHNVYGPLGTWAGGREKAPAALCRKVIEAGANGEVEIWGDGSQRRSFLYIDDCVDGLLALIQSDVNAPVNIGSDRLVTVNELLSLIEQAAGYAVKRKYDLGKPLGVAGRNSDNTLVSRLLNWTPRIPLEEGLRRLYHWLRAELRRPDAGLLPTNQ